MMHVPISTGTDGAGDIPSRIVLPRLRPFFRVGLLVLGTVAATALFVLAVVFCLVTGQVGSPF